MFNWIDSELRCLPYMSIKIKLMFVMFIIPEYQDQVDFVSCVPYQSLRIKLMCIMCTLPEFQDLVDVWHVYHIPEYQDQVDVCHVSHTWASRTSWYILCVPYLSIRIKFMCVMCTKPEYQDQVDVCHVYHTRVSGLSRCVSCVPYLIIRIKFKCVLCTIPEYQDQVGVYRVNHNWVVGSSWCVACVPYTWGWKSCVPYQRIMIKLILSFVPYLSTRFNLMCVMFTIPEYQDQIGVYHVYHNWVVGSSW